MDILSNVLAPLFRVLNSSGPTWSAGTGSPEGVITAPIGSMYSRTDGTVGTSLYRKESGSGNTGWAPIASAGGTTTIIQQVNTTDFKDSVAVATTANITLSGEQTIDGVATSASRVLVKNQNTGSQNGIYVSASGAWSRATDADADSEVTSGLLVFCEGGDTNGNKLFVLSTADPITVGTTALTFDSIVLPSNPEVLKEVTGSSYTILVTDPNKMLKMNRSSTQTITVPGASTKIGVNSVIWIMKYGTGNVTLSAAGGVTINAPQGLTLSTRYAIGRLKKIANNEWSFVIIGEGLRSDTSANLTVGYTATGYSAGTKSSGTFTPDPANGALQYYTNGGAHILAPPSTGSGDALTMVIQVTNNGSAGTITTSSFTKVTGDSLTTNNGDDFMLFITVINGFKHLHVQALQ